MGNKEYRFEKLTPMNNADISVYKEAFDFIFKNQDIKNVAVSGAYSAGKSSILESYKARHKNLKFVHISLAQFNNLEQNDIVSTDSATNSLTKQTKEMNKESILEGKILNQLIHQIPARKIPQTNFKVKKDVNKTNLCISTIVAGSFLGSILYLLFSNSIVNSINSLPENWIKNLLSPLASPYAQILAIILSWIATVVIVFSIIRAQKNRNIFRKISLQGNDIEIFEETEESYFDKYLNEVLYLFEKVEADVIVFEDMDRFNSIRIFERLREVNTLVNIHRKKETGETSNILRFFYLLRDDIFDSKDRTKFFDYIIPIIPVLDSSNSYEQFLRVFKDAGIIESIDQRFLQSLSLYVDDMRILKNIYNEFVVYFNKLNTTDLDCNKMLAMITYKNLFPRDFSDLQLSKGFVKQLFVDKEGLIDLSLMSIKSERETLVHRIERAKNEVMDTKQEIDDAYSAKVSRVPKQYNQYTNENKKLIEEYNIELGHRKQAVQDKSELNLKRLEAELDTIDSEILKTKTKLLKELITRENIDSVFATGFTNEVGETDDFKIIKSSGYFSLLKFLIRNGYIDETYSDYMTYFYNDSLSTSDKKFLRRVTDKKGAEYTYKLNDPKKIIKSSVLRQVDFEQVETLNFSIFDFLLKNENKEKYKLYLETLMFQLEKTENFDFVSNYYDASKVSNKFVMLTNKYWPSFFKDVLEYQQMSLNQIRRFSIDTINFCEEEVIATVNIDNCLTDFISETSDYLTIDNPNVDKLISGFSFIGVLFSLIEYKSANKELFDRVYEQSLYKLNFQNISLMLKAKYLIECEEEITHKNYSLIEKNLHSPLANYVLDNISEYLRVIIDNAEGRMADDEEAVINLLNNEELDFSLKEEYIQLLTTSINDITNISDSALWNTMLHREIIEFSVNNFVNYFNEYNLDEELIAFLNASIIKADFLIAADNFNEEILCKLLEAVSINNRINTEKYKEILTELDYNFENYGAIDIEDEKFEVLMKKSILQMNSESLNYVRENYVNHLYKFIELNIDRYIELQNTDNINLEELIEILKWNIGNEKKLQLLTYTNEPIPINYTHFDDTIISHLIENNLSVEDKPFLYLNYSSFEDLTKESIEKISALGVNEIIEKNMIIDDSLLSILLKSDKVNKTQKIMLFSLGIDEYDQEVCKSHLIDMGHADLSNIFTKGWSNRKYEKSDDAKTILDILKNHKWIYDYWEDKINPEKYRIRKTRPKHKNPKSEN